VELLRPRRRFSPSISAKDAEELKKGLARLVLYLLNLLKELVERQAVERLPSLKPEKQELGLDLMLLDEKLKELMKSFGVDEEEVRLEVPKSLDSLVNNVLNRLAGKEEFRGARTLARWKRQFSVRD
jgi:hypothetical protein